MIEKIANYFISYNHHQKFYDNPMIESNFIQMYNMNFLFLVAGAVRFGPCNFRWTKYHWSTNLSNSYSHVIDNAVPKSASKFYYYYCLIVVANQLLDSLCMNAIM